MLELFISLYFPWGVHNTSHFFFILFYAAAHVPAARFCCLRTDRRGLCSSSCAQLGPMGADPTTPMPGGGTSVTRVWTRETNRFTHHRVHAEGPPRTCLPCGVLPGQLSHPSREDRWGGSGISRDTSQLRLQGALHWPQGGQDTPGAPRESPGRAGHSVKYGLFSFTQKIHTRLQISGKRWMEEQTF